MPASIALSSELIGHLSTWRNRPSYRLGRICVAQMAFPLLTLMATVETVASLLIWPIHLTRCGSHLPSPLKSARFAIQWSAISLVTNLCSPCSPLPTEERRARMQIGNAEHWRLGIILAYAVGVNILIEVVVLTPAMLLALLIGSVAVAMLAIDPRRREDYVAVYRNQAAIEQYFRRGEIEFHLHNGNEVGPNFPRIRLDQQQAFIEELMNPQAFSEEARRAIEENDPAIFALLSTRAIYLYAYGSHLNDPLPHFLNDQARQHIEQLRFRADVTPELCQAVEARLRNLNFNELDAQTPQAIRALIEAGQRMLQGNNGFFRLIEEQQNRNARANQERRRREQQRVFTEELMNPRAFSEEARRAIEENDPAIFALLSTRAIYLYAYGSHRNDLLPSFFNAVARGHIEQLRLRTDVTSEICQAIEVRLRNLNFNELEEQTDEPTRSLIGAGLGSLQGNLPFFQAAEQVWRRRAFNEELMNPQAFSDEARRAIEENDPASRGLLVARTIYLYAYGSHRNDPIPSFFNAVVRGHIEQLRLRTDVTLEICQEIETRLRNLNFNELEDQTDEATRSLFQAAFRSVEQVARQRRAA